MAVMVSDIRSRVHACLHALAACSDDVTNSNHAGFNRLDAFFGCELAETSHLSLAQAVVGTRLSCRYRRQLEALGMTVPDEAEAVSWAIAQGEVISSEEMAIASELAHVLDLASVSPIDERAERGPQEEGSTDQTEKGEPKTTPARRVYVQGDRIFIEFPYDRAKVNAMQPLKASVEDWAFNRYNRQEWSFPQESASTVFSVIWGFPGFSYSVEAIQLIRRTHRKEALLRQARELEARWHELSQFAALEAAQPYLDGAPTANGQRLFRHQREAVQRMIEAERFILAHDMGLGKSRAALIAAQAYDLPIWVIAPAGTLINWQREAAAAGVSITLFSWAKLPEPPEDLDYVLITDEAHYAQAGEGSVRGQGFLNLSAQARAVFMLSGTPIKNSLPINLWPLLVAAKHPLAADRSTYEQRYCGAYFKSIGRKKTVYDVSGASNLEELHERTRDVMLYKKKSECIDLPDKLRVQRQAEVTSTGEVAYRKTIERLREAHLERMADKYEALRAGREDLLGEGTDESDLGIVESEDAFALVELGIYRHAASLAKVESAVEIAQEAREQGQGVLLFTAFRDTAERIATKLDTDCLTGEVTGARRQAMIDRFQAEESKMLVATIGAGGIGINLTAAQVVVMVDRAWTPGDTEQAEDRCIAQGQLVMTENGLKPIEDIQIGERVLTHLGQWQRVLATKKREHRGLMTQITYTRYSEPLFCTHDHKIYVKRGSSQPEWIQAHEALPGDYVAMPRPSSLQLKPIVSLPAEARYEGTFINNWGVTQTNGRYKMLAEQFELNEDLLWLFGWYLAEGFASTVSGKGRFISLSGHVNERPILERMQQTLLAMGVKSTIYSTVKPNALELRAFSYELAHWFSQWFGDACENKRIPSFLLNLPSSQAKTLFDAYVAGDGYARKRKQAIQQEWVSVSPALASQMALLALQSGYAPTLKRVINEHNYGHWIGSYTVNGLPDNKALSTWDEQYVYHPIRKVETFFAQRRPTPTYVYDLTVEDDHSFVVGQAVVHNCHRLGQRHNVTSIWLQYGPVDEKIDQLLELKQERIETILRGRSKNLRGVPGIRALAKEIMESVHTGKSLAEILGLDPADFELEVVDLVRDDVAPGEPQPGLKKDGRLKGLVRRVRRNISLDEEVVAFLETLKASNQTAPKEGGYSGFLERLVRQSPEFQVYHKR